MADADGGLTHQALITPRFITSPRRREATFLRAARALTDSLDPEAVLSALCQELARAAEADVVTVRVGGRVEQLAPGSASGAVRSEVSVPLHQDGDVIGTISLGFLDGRAVAPEEVELLAAFADVAGVALRNAEDHAALRREANLDPLTGCLNHGAFHERLREEVARAQRGADPFALVLLDLEGLKAVNETLGHLSGDEMLRTVGAVLRAGVRVQDQVARFGGDEFALILPDTGGEAAHRLVERLTACLSAAPHPGERPIHAHAGLAEWRPGDTPKSVMERADRMLREDKRARARSARRRRRVRGAR